MFTVKIIIISLCKLEFSLESYLLTREYLVLYTFVFLFQWWKKGTLQLDQN
jgi:hypothetical protein